MRRGMSKPRGLKIRRYTARLVDLNYYLYSFPGATLADKIIVTDLKVFLIVCLVYGLSKRMCRVFNVNIFHLKKIVNMLERMDIAESIYEGVVETSY